MNLIFFILMAEYPVNCTPHKLNIYDADNKLIVSLPSVCSIRLTSKQEPAGHIGQVPLVTPQIFTGLDRELPDVKQGVIVSDFVARYIAGDHKYPVYSPDTSPAAAVRTLTGEIIGTRRLVLYSKEQKNW